MRAVLFDRPGDESVLHVGEWPEPELGPSDVRIRVTAAGVNRADLLQRAGLYPPPPGASPVLGLECAGTVMEAGPQAGPWKPGDRVMALLAGGGYAEQVVVDSGLVMPVPDHFTDIEAGAFPEVFLTAFLNLFLLGGANTGDRVLVHGGGSGVGTAAISLCREAGVGILVTAGSDAKCSRCRELGALGAFNYRSGDFADWVREQTGGAGVRVVLDCVGAPYLRSNLSCLADDGRLVVIGLIGGAKAEMPLGALLSRRLQVIGSTLRSRSLEDKRSLVAAFLQRFGDALAGGRLRPVIDSVYPLDRVAEAHARMKASLHFGKLVLTIG